LAIRVSGALEIRCDVLKVRILVGEMVNLFRVGVRAVVY
jgi:hypothetical protein